MERNTLKVLLFYGFILAFVFLCGEMEDMEIHTPNDYARITDMDYKAVVCDNPGDQGKVNVTERIKFNIHAASKSNPFWELWRDLVEDNVDGLKVSYKVNSVKQILNNGTEIEFEKSPKLYWEDEDYLYYNRWYHSPGPYNESYRRYECVFFYVNGLYRETPTYEINYDMYNATLRYNDSSELYLSLYSEDSIKYLKSFNAQILVPNEDMPQAGNYEFFTLGTNTDGFPVQESDSLNPGYHTFSFSLDKNQLKFKPYNQYIEFALISFGEDKHKFSEYANINTYSHDNVLSELRAEKEDYTTTAKEYYKIKCGLFIICIVASGLVIISTLKTNKKLKEKYNFYEPEMQHIYFRDIPSNLDPYFAANLVFCKHKQPKDTTDNYSAILLSLVRKKYIELSMMYPDKGWKSDNIMINIKYQPKVITDSPDDLNLNIEDTFTTTAETLEPLTLSEEYYFNLILKYATNNMLMMKAFQFHISRDYENTDTFVKNIEDSVVLLGISQNYFQKAKYKEPRNNLMQRSTTFILLGILLLVFLNLISHYTRLDFAFGGYSILGIVFIACAIYLRKISSKYVLLTQFGENEYSKWRGLYNFLNSETLMSERTVVELPLWEQYLVYATAFGISDKVIRAIQIRCPDMSSSPMLSNSYYRSPTFHYNSHSFHTAMHHASHVARSGSHSYGYGGGGRGGGGGRRRTLNYNYKKE